MADPTAPVKDDAVEAAEDGVPSLESPPEPDPAVGGDVYVAGFVSDADGGVIDRVLADSDAVDDDATVVWLESQPDDRITMDQMVDRLGPDAVEWDSEPQPYGGAPQAVQAALAGEESLTATDRVLDDVEERLRRAEGLATGLVMDSVQDETLPEDPDDEDEDGDGDEEPSVAAKVAAAMSDASDEVAADGEDPEEEAADEEAGDRAEELSGRMDRLEAILSELLEAATHDEDLAPEDDGTSVVTEGDDD